MPPKRSKKSTATKNAGVSRSSKPRVTRQQQPMGSYEVIQLQSAASAARAKASHAKGKKVEAGSELAFNVGVEAPSPALPLTTKEIPSVSPFTAKANTPTASSFALMSTSSPPTQQDQQDGIHFNTTLGRGSVVSNSDIDEMIKQEQLAVLRKDLELKEEMLKNMKHEWAAKNEKEMEPEGHSKDLDKKVFSDLSSTFKHIHQGLLRGIIGRTFDAHNLLWLGTHPPSATTTNGPAKNELTYPKNYGNDSGYWSNGFGQYKSIMNRLYGADYPDLEIMMERFRATIVHYAKYYDWQKAVLPCAIKFQNNVMRSDPLIPSKWLISDAELMVWCKDHPKAGASSMSKSNIEATEPIANCVMENRGHGCLNQHCHFVHLKADRGVPLVGVLRPGLGRRRSDGGLEIQGGGVVTGPVVPEGLIPGFSFPNN